MEGLKTKIDILSYSHDRKSHYKVTADELYNLINKFTDQEELSNLYHYFTKHYDLPKSVVKQTIRQYLARSYYLKKNKFSEKLNLKNIPRYVLRYSALIYALFFVRIIRKVKKFKLIVDDITSPLELKRFEKLINLYDKDNVLIISRNLNFKKNFQYYQVYNKKLFRGFNIFDLLKSIYKELFIGIWVTLKVSLSSKVNLFPISLLIIQSFLSFKSIFEVNKATYIIQGKHYNTEPIKNYMFKYFGGVASTSIQKNIIQTDPIFFYLDIDIFFSLGQEGYDRIIEYGGRIDKIKPVGSLFMEYAWFERKKNTKKKYDIAVVGINTSNAYERLDSFNEFMQDYYSLYNWISRLSLEKKNCNFVLIHHSNAGDDKIENDILSGSNVKVLDKNNNSYEIAFSSKLAITYGSTMGYELNAHNLPTFFIDPGYRCSFLPEKGYEYIDKMRVNDYDSFSLLINEILDKDKIINTDNKNLKKWCLHSSDVSNRIHKYFIDKQ